MLMMLGNQGTAWPSWLGLGNSSRACAQGCDIHLVLTNIHVYIHQKCIYTYIHIHIHQDFVLWQLQPLQTWAGWLSGRPASAAALGAVVTDQCHRLPGSDQPTPWLPPGPQIGHGPLCTPAWSYALKRPVGHRFARLGRWQTTLASRHWLRHWL